MAQWIRIHLPMQGARVWSLVQEDPTCRKATKPAPQLLSLRATTTKAQVPRACALQQEKTPQGEARALQRRVAPACHSLRKPVRGNEDPVQPKINKIKS